MVKVRKNLIGEKFCRLTILKQVEDYIKPDGRHEAKWLCECECGNYIETTGDCLKSGRTKSCGCLIYETSSKIGKKSKGVKKKHNVYDLSGEYGIGYTVNNKTEFWFDKEDYNLIKDYTWSEHNGYIRTTTNGTEILMHRLIMQISDKNIVIDHLGHNTFDNRKSKLRVTESIGNQKNKSLSKNNTSGVTGVSWEERTQKWHSYIWVNKKCLHLGRFIDFDDAVKVRKEAEEKYFGEYSYDNSMRQYNESGESNEYF